MDFRKIARLFDAALDQPAPERDEWLAESCADDPATRREVERMLDAHERTGGILDRLRSSPPS